MLLLIFGCVFWRNNIGVQQQKTKTEVHLSSTLRYLHLFGPSMRLHLDPKPTYASVGIEASPALVFGEVISPESIQSNFITEMYFLSAIGIDLVGIHSHESRVHLSALSPYIQLHTPVFCPITKREKMLCFTGFAEGQYQLIKGAPNNPTWNAGLAVHFGKGLFPY